MPADLLMYTNKYTVYNLAYQYVIKYNDTI